MLRIFSFDVLNKLLVIFTYYLHCVTQYCAKRTLFRLESLTIKNYKNANSHPRSCF